MGDTTILVRFLKNHIHARIGHPKGSKMEVSPELFKKMRRLGAVEAVEIAVAGSGNLSMEVAKAKSDKKRQEAADGTQGKVASLPRGRRMRRTGRPPNS